MLLDHRATKYHNMLHFYLLKLILAHAPFIFKLVSPLTFCVMFDLSSYSKYKFQYTKL
jgi:hypothetical protein